MIVFLKRFVDKCLVGNVFSIRMRIHRFIGRTQSTLQRSVWLSMFVIGCLIQQSAAFTLSVSEEVLCEHCEEVNDLINSCCNGDSAEESCKDVDCECPHCPCGDQTVVTVPALLPELVVNSFGGVGSPLNEEVIEELVSWSASPRPPPPKK